MAHHCVVAYDESIGRRRPLGVIEGHLRYSWVKDRTATLMFYRGVNSMNLGLVSFEQF